MIEIHAALGLFLVCTAGIGLFALGISIGRKSRR